MVKRKEIITGKFQQTNIYLLNNQIQKGQHIIMNEMMITIYATKY